MDYIILDTTGEFDNIFQIDKKLEIGLEDINPNAL